MKHATRDQGDRAGRTRRTGRTTRTRRAARTGERRGVIGVLSMMFLVIFGSLAVAMAVVSQGNLRTADTHKRIVRAQGALDTGLGIAAARLREAAGRFMVEKGSVNADYALDLWNGNYPSTPVVTVLPPADGRQEPSPSRGIAEALRQHHAADAAGDLPEAIVLGAAPAGWVRGTPIGLERDEQGRFISAAQIDYAPPDARGRILVIVTGYEWDWLRERWVSRTAQQFFQVGKTLKHAIVSPSRVMLGKNVQVNGPLGIAFDEPLLNEDPDTGARTVDQELAGSPLVSRSDFAGLSDQLDSKLQYLSQAILNDDRDNDNRLRTRHPVESRSLGSLDQLDFNGDGNPDQAFGDVTGDRMVDDFDLFLRHFGRRKTGSNPNGLWEVFLPAPHSNGTAGAGQSPAFTADVALGVLIDSGLPDRNRNGRWNGEFVSGAWDYSTFNDNNRDGDRDAADIDEEDIRAGYRDGIVDYKDQYAKIRGGLRFRASRSNWEDYRDEFGVEVGDYQKVVSGAIRPPRNESAVGFDASTDEVPEFTPESFANAAEIMGDFGSQPGVDSTPFNAVISAQLNAEFAIEPTPYGSPSPGDWYRRPVYRNLVFRNTTIPWGANALFIDCTFIGVTRIRTYENNTHPSWIYYGEEVRNSTTGQLSLRYPPPPAASDAQLDKSYAQPQDIGYADLPDALMVDLDGNGSNESQITNTKTVSNNIRFHNCLVIGSVVADKPAAYTHLRNKLTFTGSTRFTDVHPDRPDDPALNLDNDELEITSRSSMMAPHYSVDIGTYNSPQSQDVRLKGAIIAGVLDVRGNTRVDGALLLTFKPVHGEPPLEEYGFLVGNPQNFNATLGYFGPDDGDGEGIDVADMRDLDNNGSIDIGWDSARDTTGALVAVGTAPVLDTWFDGIPDEDAIPATHIRRAIPFNGFGRIVLNLDPNLVLPDGLAGAVGVSPLRSTYREGRYASQSD